MRWAWPAIFSIVIAGIFSCRKDVSRGENSSLQSIVSTNAITDSILVADSLDTSGVDYIDNIYDLSAGADAAKAFPVYHSILGEPLPCQGTDTTQSTCIFDETDLDGNGSSDIPGANKNKLIVNRKTGAIDLSASYTAGVFGPNPQNGARRAFTFFYRLDDNTKRSLDQVTIQLIYYKRKSDVPQILVNEIAARKQQYLVSTTSSTTSTLTAYAIVYKPKRPPLIVIVSGL